MFRQVLGRRFKRALGLDRKGELFLLKERNRKLSPMTSGEELMGSRSGSPSLSLPERIRSLTSVRSRSSASRSDRWEESTVPLATEDYVRTEAEFRDDAARILQDCKTAEDFTDAATDFAQEVEKYSLEALLSIWEKLSSLIKEDASAESRKAGFTLLEASAAHKDLSLEDRRRFAHMIMVPVRPALVELQIKTLRALTKDGSQVDPFTDLYTKYLNTTIKSQYNALAEKRREKKTLEGRGNIDSLRGPFPEEEKGLQAIFSLAIDTITSNPDAIKGEVLVVLIRRVLHIAEVCIC